MGNVMAAQRLLHVVLYGTGFYVGIKTFCVDEWCTWGLTTFRVSYFWRAPKTDPHHGIRSLLCLLRRHIFFFQQYK